MELRVLGPLEVWRDDELVELRGSKRRALLALLILHANEVVRTDRLIDELWGEERPANASAALQNHVSRLRKDLGADVVVTKPWGYVLRADPDSIDLQRFERLVVEAKPLAAAERKEKLTDALALWRGAPLADLSDEPAIAAEMRRLEELRLSAVEQRIDADLELGGSLELVPELESLIAAHPLRERLRGQLILALYRGGRQAEALETYRETRRVLVEELGIEPSPELRELERSILRQDPALAVAPPLAVVADPEPEQSRWRWPRSPLVVAAAALMLLTAAAAGLAIALSMDGGPAESSAALPAPPPAPEPPPAAEPPTAPPPPSREPPTPPPPRKSKPTKADNTSGGSGDDTTIPQIVSLPPPPPPPPPAKQGPNPPPPPAHPKPEKPAKQPPPPQPSTPPPPAAPQRWVYWLADDFEDAAPDYGVWFQDTNVEAAVRSTEQNGRLQMTIDPNGLPAGSNFTAVYGTKCTFGGDFDARVNFELVSWPAKDGVVAFLKAWFQGETLATQVGRAGGSLAGGSPFEQYVTSLRSFGNAVQTADTTGALRIVRRDGNVTTYYRYRGQWTPLGTRFLRGVVSIHIGVGASAADFGNQPAVIAFDDFRVTAPEGWVECLGVPYPPRKPRPKT